MKQGFNAGADDITVESDLLNDTVVLQFCDRLSFLCRKRERDYKTCPLSSTLENSGSESQLAWAAAALMPAEERGVASWCADFQENKEIDPVSFAVLCLVLSKADMFDSKIQKGFHL